MPPRKRFKLELRQQVKNRVVEIKQYIDEQRSLDPPDEVGLRTALRVLQEIDSVAYLPWLGAYINAADVNYRQRVINKTYILYYYVKEAENLVQVLELRHGKQKTLSFSTLKRYKREMDQE